MATIETDSSSIHAQDLCIRLRVYRSLCEVENTMIVKRSQIFTMFDVRRQICLVGRNFRRIVSITKC